MSDDDYQKIITRADTHVLAAKLELTEHERFAIFFLVGIEPLEDAERRVVGNWPQPSRDMARYAQSVCQKASRESDTTTLELVKALRDAINP